MLDPLTLITLVKPVKTVDYDSVNDIFCMSTGERVISSIDFGDFICDVNSDNHLCGIEILDASNNLKQSRKSFIDTR